MPLCYQPAMTDRVPIVDLFSGPGGLAEGFAAVKDLFGRPCFNVVLSIEMDSIAHRTCDARKSNESGTKNLGVCEQPESSQCS